MLGAIRLIFFPRALCCFFVPQADFGVQLIFEKTITPAESIKAKLIFVKTGRKIFRFMIFLNNK